jgi:hypothetical protein
MYQVRTELSYQVLASGSERECIQIVQAFKTYGLREDKFEIVQIEPITFLSESVRSEAKSHIADSISENSFGDGQEREMAWEGGSIKGASEYTDLEIYEFYQECDWEGDSTWETIQAEYEVFKILTEVK